VTDDTARPARSPKIDPGVPRGGIVAGMRRAVWPIAAVVVVSCGYPPLDQPPTVAPVGLDERPANATCVAKPRPVIDTGVRLERQWSGITFESPMFLTQAPGDTQTWYVVERAGRVRAFPQNATSDAQTRIFATVAVNVQGEGGLLSMAFHPRWGPDKREVYLSYTRSPVRASDPAPVCIPATTSFDFTSVVARMQSTNNGMSLDVGPDEFLKVGHPFTNHNGGHIEFGRDGMLYFGLGDGGSGGDPCGAGQNMASLLGKLVRLDIDAPAGMYKVPPDNPFVGTPGARPEIWSRGHRNPWRWSFDRATGELWLGEVGQNTWEEIDRVVKGGNYGWNTCEGFHRSGSTTALCNTPGMIDPIVEHGRTEARSITGGYVYRGAAMPSLVGTYIYGDFETGNIWALLFDGQNRPTPRPIGRVAAGSLVSFAQGHDGEVYVVQLSGAISKLVPAAAPPPDNFPKLLSQTGCVDPGNARRPASGLIPYDVNSPLWSDAADKERFLAIPDGEKITINAEQDWDLPIGSVLMKTFTMGGERIETRLFMRHDDGEWGGYTYEWNDAGTDADLLPAGKVVALGAGTAWAYPSRDQCIQCHSQAAGGTIGLETAQLNRDTVYPATNRQSNQLATLQHIGMFAAPLTAPPEEAPRLADPTGTESAEARARSYLHANCAHCHRPNGGAQGTMDVRYTLPFGSTMTCDAQNVQGAIGAATRLIVPGQPETSVLSLRMQATDAKRMPPVAVTIADPIGTLVIDDWIRSLTACP
jgi:uncharacterized repeat protein (TIGR03806 family)